MLVMHRSGPREGWTVTSGLPQHLHRDYADSNQATDAQQDWIASGTVRRRFSYSTVAAEMSCLSRSRRST
jgi:hypothetical protein